MGDAMKIYENKVLKENDGKDVRHDQWVILQSDNDDLFDSISIESSSFEDSNDSIASSSSSDIVEDATSTSSSSTDSCGPLYELSELMEQLPIKRGLSKYYQGKSQTFASLASVKSLEDLAKKGSPYRKKMKPCKSYGGGLDGQKAFSPKPTISKKASRGSLLSSLGKKGTFVGSFRSSPTSVLKEF